MRKRLGRVLLGVYKRRKQAQSDLSLSNCLNAARTTASKTKYCFLITHGEKWPTARLVEPICDLERWIFFIGTNPSLRKIKEISQDARVTLAFGNAAENANLVVYGTAKVRTDLPTRCGRWKGTWRLFFPDGPRGDDYVVIEICAEQMEVVSFRRNVIPEPFGLRPVLLQRMDADWGIVAQQAVPADAAAPCG
jgi:general stress protein 26